jgi:hypothetical protein
MELWVEDAPIASGGEEEDRTPDLVIANDALSQLSYPPTGASLPKPMVLAYACPFFNS